MANTCENTLTISGDPKRVKEGNAFEGDYTCQGGCALEDECRDIPEEDEEEADDNADTPPETVETGKPEN